MRIKATEDYHTIPNILPTHSYLIKKVSDSFLHQVKAPLAQFSEILAHDKGIFRSRLI